MPSNAKFSIGFLKVSGSQEHMFLSVTPNLEHGPGIQRDGITAPRMIDPHSVPFTCMPRGLQPQFNLGHTTDAFEQRAGTWTLYHHLKEFVLRKGAEWQVIGVQSNGDLTMNPWHVAYVGTSHIADQNNFLCGLLLEDKFKEPIDSRIYRCLVKWNDTASERRGLRYEFLDLKMSAVHRGYAVSITEPQTAEACEEWLKGLPGYNEATKDIGGFLEFALSGKPIVEKGVELSLSYAVDRFQDIRHIFNLPTVKAEGFYGGRDVKEINFGEFQLFCNLNERRAALLSAVIIDLNILDNVKIDWKDLEDKLKTRHFRETNESPTRRGQYRKYSDDIARDKVEVFFPHNVYPFGVIGLHDDEMFCLASGGLSGRVGNTLEGITRIMFDFFGCEDAMVLDEGFDTFQVVNPSNDDGTYRYTNEQLLAKILTFTKHIADEEHRQSGEKFKDVTEHKVSPPYRRSGGLKEWPLNKNLFDLVDEDYLKLREAEDFSDVLIVRPHRSQMRSVLIFAVKKA